MNKSYLLATSIAVIATGWVMSGLIGSSDAQEQPIEAHHEKEKKIPEVRVKNSVAQTLENDIVVTGMSQASKTVQLSAEVEGQIAEIFKEEGDIIKAGEIIAKIEKNDKAARLLEAEKLVEQRDIEYKAARALENKGYNSKIKLASARTNLESAKAAKKQAEIDLENTSIVSPIDGIISTQDVEVGDYVNTQGSDPLFSVVDLTPIEFVGYVSERSILEVQKGSEATITFMNGMQHHGTVSYIAPAADPQTRTFRVLITAENPNSIIVDGLTAKIRIPTQQKKAHQISPSILALSDKGELGVKIVKKDNSVEFITVDVLKDTPDYMWVGGLPEKVQIITVGQEFILDGQVVKPVISETKGAL